MRNKRLITSIHKWLLGLLMILIAITSYGQAEFFITGTTYDQNDEPIVGVTIMITGTTYGTTSDVDGKFRLPLSNNAESLTISSMGFETLEIPIGSQTNFNLSLSESTKRLKELIITGYGQNQNERLVSNSVSSIKATHLIQDRPVPSIEGALQGMDPSLVILQQSGSPGAPMTVRMRGVGTADNATPLMLLNGFQLPDMGALNPNDIQSVGIFKDAASSAIYGARGGNGVISIATRKGQTGKWIHGNILSYAGVQSLVTEGDYLTGREYAQYYNDTWVWNYYHGSTEGFPFNDKQIALLPNTTWIREITNDAPIREFHVGLSGGKNKTSYYLGAGSLYQGGIIGNTDFARNTVNLNLQTEVGKLKISTIGFYTDIDRHYIAENSDHSWLMSAVASLPGIYPVYDENGEPFNPGDSKQISANGVPLSNISEIGNPVVRLKHTTNLATINTLFGNVLLSYEMAPYLTLNTSYGHLIRKIDQKGFTERFAYSHSFDNDINSLNEQSYQEINWQWEGYLRYEKSFVNHHLDAVMGMSFLKDGTSSTGRTGWDFSINSFEKVSFKHHVDTASLTEFLPWEIRNTIMSYYGRINYHFDKKYLFGFTLRADGSSKFGPGNRWGFFPSVSTGWVLSDESFFEIPAVDLLKIRGSWGVNGNDRIQPYQWADRYQLQGVVGSVTPHKQDFNPDIKWEEISQTNIGIDLTMFDDRFALTMDYYLKSTKDMLVAYPNPSFTGLPTPIRNAATVSNKGLEVSLRYRNNIGDLNFDINANVGFHKNEITDLNGGLPLTGARTRTFDGSPELTYSDVGTPIASFYGYVIDSLNEIGNPVYTDLSGPDGVPDGEIDPEYDRKIIGNAYPNRTFGIRLNMDFKGFDLNIFASGYSGNDVVNASMGYWIANTNRTKRVLNAWSTENPDSKIMRPSANEVVNNEYSDYYIEDGSFLKLRSISIGYTLKTEITEKIRLSKVRIYLSGNNLITLTRYSGFDPEIGVNWDPRDVGIDRGFYPQAKSIIGGIQIAF